MTTAPPAEKAARRPADGALAVLRAAPRPVRYVLAGVLVNQLGAFVQSFLVLYLLHQGFTEQQGGIALGCYSVGAVAGSLAGGELTRRLGPRRTIVLSMFGSALLVVSISLVGRPSAFPLLLAVTVLAGLAAQTYRPAAGSLLSDLTPADRQVMVMSLFRIAMNTGGTLGPLLASWLLLIDWNLLFWANGVAAACYGVIALLLLPRTTAAGRPADVPQAGAEPTAGYRALLGDGRFVLYLTAMGFSALIYAQYFAVLPLKLTEDGHSTVLYSAVLTISGAMVVGCELFVTKYVQRWRAGTAGGVG
ncbi:MFS transporter, partial [Kitasatospora sp. NPDC036755]|uniref:MFS transporter n=1 Tax=Kitasatospora sp. NPDC036755 TaxID=3154600 RepID=UPI0033FC6B1D